MNFAIGGVAVAALILGITEALKEAGVKGKASRLVVFILGTLFVAIAAANEKALIDPDIMQWVNLGVTALAGGLAAMGYYDFTKPKPQLPEATIHNHAVKKITADVDHHTQF
jgi:hypothetical protein